MWQIAKRYQKFNSPVGPIVIFERQDGTWGMAGKSVYPSWVQARMTYSAALVALSCFYL